MSAFLHDMGGDINVSDPDSVGRLPDSLALEGANIGTEEVLCIQDVCM